MDSHTLAARKAQDMVARPIQTARFRAVKEGVLEPGSLEWEHQQASAHPQGMCQVWDARQRKVVTQEQLDMAEMLQLRAQPVGSTSSPFSQPNSTADAGAPASEWSLVFGPTCMDAPPATGTSSGSSSGINRKGSSGTGTSSGSNCRATTNLKSASGVIGATAAAAPAGEGALGSTAATAALPATPDGTGQPSTAAVAPGKLAPISNVPRAPSLPLSGLSQTSADARAGSVTPTDLLRVQLSAKSLPSLLTAGVDRSVFDHARVARIEAGDHRMVLSEHRQVTIKSPGVYTAKIFVPGNGKEKEIDDIDALLTPGSYNGGWLRGVPTARMGTPGHHLRRPPAATLSRLNLTQPSLSSLSRSSSSRDGMGGTFPRFISSLRAVAAAASLQGGDNNSMGGASDKEEEEEEDRAGQNSFGDSAGSQPWREGIEGRLPDPEAQFLQASTAAERFASKHAAPRRVVSLPAIPLAKGSPKSVRIQEAPHM